MTPADYRRQAAEIRRRLRLGPVYSPLERKLAVAALRELVRLEKSCSS